MIKFDQEDNWEYLFTRYSIFDQANERMRVTAFSWNPWGFSTRVTCA